MSFDPAEKILQRIEALAQISDHPAQLTRLFCSPAMRRANDLVHSWMREAGMTVREDAIGNLIGHYPAATPDAKVLLLGSHLDTVPNAGKFDGPLGVLLGIACVEQLHQTQTRLPFAIEVIGFADEEGVRYQAAYLGSKVLAGLFNENDLQRIDQNGITMTDAIRGFGGQPEHLSSAKLDAERLLGYIEAHIEQGPVLEQKQLPLGIVTAIAGQGRIKLRFIGQAGHAGTTPMSLRKDALVAAAQFITSIDPLARRHPGLVATVGQIEARPGASNVIPGEVNLALDVRHAIDAVRHSACEELRQSAETIQSRTGVLTRWEVVQETSAVACSPELSNLLAQAAGKCVPEVCQLHSGAGHDAAIMAQITPAAMLFIRCKGGISHHPDEFVTTEDVRIALAVMDETLKLLANRSGDS